MEEILETFERNEELRCMDYIDIAFQKKLYVGTNRGVILTIDISDLLQLEIANDDFDMEMDMNMDYHDEPEQINSSNRKKGKRYEQFENDGPSMTHQQIIDQQNKILGK